MRDQQQQRRSESVRDEDEGAERQPSRDVLKARSLAFARADAAKLRDPEAAQSIADRGVAGTASEMPHGAEIQRAFGDHDIGGIQAHVGGKAAAASAELGADAYATGDRVAFKSAPDLHTAAHEAAHVVQHRQGVQLLGGMGSGDAAAEAHADAVADRVVAGQSAQHLLDAAPAASGVHRQKADDADQGLSTIPRLTVDKPQLTFGAAQVGQTYTEYLRVTNDGDEAVEVQPPSVGGPFTAYLMGASYIEPGESTFLMVVYKPTSAGQAQELLSVTLPGGTGISVLVSANAIEPPKAADPAQNPMAPQPMGPHPLAPLPTIFDEGNGSVPTPPADVSTPAPRASMLTATPDELRYGELNVFEESSIITLWNDGPDVVTIDDVYVVGGDRAFDAELMDVNEIEPGAAANVEIQYRPANNTGTEATLVVQTDDGAVLRVPMSGPAVTDKTSGPVGNLEVMPDMISFQPTVLRNASYADVLVRNRGLRPVTIAQVRAPSDVGFHLQAGYKAIEIGPGRTEKIGLVFTPLSVGQKLDTVYLEDKDGANFGMISVSGEAVEEAKQPDTEETAAPTVAPLCEPLDPQTEQQRKLAHVALRSWVSATNTAAQNAHFQLLDDIGHYLQHTSSDPTISRQTAPDASVYRSLLSNAFGNAISDFGVQGEKRVAGVARSLVNKIGSKVGIEEPGRMVGLVGVGAGFVIGVVVETLAGMLFDYLFPDDSVEKALTEAYEQGGADMALQLGDQIREQIGDANEAKIRADAIREKQETEVAARVDASCSAQELGELVTDLNAKTADAKALKATPGTTVHGLLTMWVRDHAQSTTHGAKGLDKQWEKVTEELAKADPDHFEKGKVKNQADLFMAQCLHEWSVRGLEAPPELQEAVYAEMAVDNDGLTDASQADGLARRLQKRFNMREFVWTDNIRWDRLEQGLPEANGDSSDGQEWVSFYPALKVEDGCCVVDHFEYRIARGVTETNARTTPGDRKWQSINRRSHEPKTKPQHVAGLEVYDVMAQLENQGYAVLREADAATNAALQAQFGEKAAVPAVTHADGRPDPVVVYKACVPADAIEGIPVTEKSGEVRMYRGGNVILLIEPCATSD